MTTEAGASLLLFLVPVLVTATIIILRCTRRFSKDAEEIVRSVEESNVLAWLEQNGPAMIRRLGDGQQQKQLGNSQSPISPLKNREPIDMEAEVPDDDYGRQGAADELKTVLFTEPQPEPSEDQGENKDEEDEESSESEFKPLGTQ